MYFLYLFILLPFFLFAQSISDKILNEMSLEEKIGQLIMAPACPKRKDHHQKDLEELCEKYHIGGLIVKQSDPKSQIEALNHLQSFSNLPLLVSADAEWGLGMRMGKTISYPKNIDLQYIEDNQLLFDLGCEIARQLKLVGVHINLAPVVDVNNNPKNPTVSKRVFGKDPIIVTTKAKYIAMGMQSQNILATAKHFPGYSDIEIDPHLDLPATNHDLTRLEEVDFVPYKELIKNDIALIMTAHILLPNISDIPATMSKKITKDLIRNKLGFKGLIITDALNMKALTNIYSIEDIALYSHIAGNDILLYGDHINPNIDDIIMNQIPRAFAAIKTAYLQGILSEENLNEHVLRILKAKEKLGLFDNRYVDDFDENKLNSEYAYKLKEHLENLIDN